MPTTTGDPPVSDDPAELLLNSTWRPTLSVTGVDGIPSLPNAGNVLRPITKLKLSLRIPPTCDADAATRALKRVLELDPPYGAFGLNNGLEDVVNLGWKMANPPHTAAPPEAPASERRPGQAALPAQASVRTAATGAARRWSARTPVRASA